jgi:hypothetical protein
LTARKPAVGVGATWQFAGTPPSLAASTHVRDSGEALNDNSSTLRKRDEGHVYSRHSLCNGQVSVTTL